MRLLVTGATGTAGSAVVRQALADPRVARVTTLARRDLDVSHPKLVQVRVEDFLDLAPAADAFVGQDAALWCLGTSQHRVDRSTLHRITVDMVVEGARRLLAGSPTARFLHLSGQGADPTLRARMLFAQEKGMAENALDALPLAKLWHARPGYIHPAAPLRDPLLQDRIMGRLAPLLRKVAPGTMIDADDLARAMIRVAAEGHPRRVLTNRDLRALATPRP